MQHLRFASAIWYAVLVMKIFGIIPGEFNNTVPGCTVTKDDNLEITVKCSEFHLNYTPNLLPNKTKRFSIYNVENLPVDKPLVPNLIYLNHLGLSFNHIHNITKIMFDGLENLLHINLANNYIQFIPQDAFSNNPNLEVVDLTENRLASMQSFIPSLGLLKNLKHLHLSSNRLLRWIKNNDLIPLENCPLLTLDLSLCTLRNIDSNAFRSVKSLTSLNIAKNPLTQEGLNNISHSLRRENLKELNVAQMRGMSYFPCPFLRWLESTAIEVLDITGNRLVCFPKGTYTHLKSLTIKESNIYQLFPHSFSQMPDLEYLEINEHFLTSIDQEFKWNFQLKLLDLSHFVGMKNTVYFEITDYVFENQIQLILLKMWDLPIKTNIRRYTLYGLRNVQEISFYKGAIPSVDCYAFETLNNLIHLDLSNNLVYKLSNCSFYGLVKVKKINLSNNLLSFINEAHPFQYTPELDVLYLGSNRIATLPVGVFEKLNNIGLIFLNNNMIRPWQRSFLPKSKNFTTLLLNANSITHFTDEMLEDVSSVKILDFSENPIDCSYCTVSKLQEWMVNNTSIIRKLRRSGAYVCDAPETLKGIPINEANTSSSTLHCVPEEKDTLKILLIAFFTILSIAVICVVIWHRWSWNIRYRIFLLQVHANRFKEHVLSSNSFEYDAYVFYCENDLGWIRHNLVPALENDDRQIRLCLADRDFDARISVLDNVISAVDKSRSTVVVLSEDCIDSPWCSYTIQMAQNILFEKNRSGLIIILLGDIQINKLCKNLQYILRTRTCIWWTENPAGQKLFWERLHLAVMKPADRGISAHIT